MRITRTKQVRLDETEQELIRLYRGLDEKRKPLMITCAEALADAPPRTHTNIINFPKQD